MISRIWLLATTGGVPGRSLLVAMLVGALLTLINQYDALFGSTMFNWYKAGLTDCVPYCVATYGAVTAKW